MGVRVVEARRGHAVVSSHSPCFDAAKYFPLVKTVDITFTGMARTDLLAQATLDDDEIARIEAAVADKGKADFVLDAVVTDEAGQTVSVTRGLCQLRAHGVQKN
jgi:hypothetical protein